MNLHEGPYKIGSKSFTAVAINTAAKAGEWIQTQLNNYTKLDTKSSSKDLVTEVDQGAETLIRNLLLTHFPHHEILGEEGVASGAEAARQALQEAKKADYLWIIDPIDGTTNFVHGFPFYSVSIALAHKGEMIVGVVYDPSQDEMFVAEKGKGAYLRGERLKVSGEMTIGESLAATGLSPDLERGLPANMQAFQDIAPQLRNIRMSGSAALHMAYVAAGRLTTFYEFGLNVWDIAAGVLLVEEAGGNVTDLYGAPYALETEDILATNGHVHEAFVEELDKVVQKLS